MRDLKPMEEIFVIFFGRGLLKPLIVPLVKVINSSLKFSDALLDAMLFYFIFGGLSLTVNWNVSLTCHRKSN
jgi:hypothetical protein